MPKESKRVSYPKLSRSSKRSGTIKAADGPGNVIDTAGWDTSFAIHYDAANASIVRDWSKIDDRAKNMDEYSDPCTIDATLGPWQLVLGGDGRNVWMDIPVESGELTGIGNGYDLSGGVAQVEINLNYVPDPVSDNDNLVVNTDGSAICREFRTDNQFITPVINSIIVGMFTEWIQNNLDAFNYVFHYLNISNTLYEDPTWHFIKPTSVSYAVTDLQTMQSSVFGVLTMLDDHPVPAGEPHQVSPYAIPDTCNSGFNISGPIFAQDMMLTGAAAQFEQPDWVRNADNYEEAFNQWVEDSFEAADDGMTIWNVAEMTFGTFKDDDGINRTMKVDANCFRLSITYTEIKFEFIDLYYEYSPGIMVNINYQQFFTVKLVDVTDEKTGDPKKVFGLDAGVRECKVVVTKSKAVAITEIVSLICLSIAGAILGGLAGEAAAGVSAAGEAATETIVETSTAATAVFAPETLFCTGIELTSDMATVASAELLGETIGDMYGMLARMGPKLLGSMIGAGAGATLALIPSYVELSAMGKFDELPYFDVFANNCIAAHNWPYMEGYTLKMVDLNSSFQIGGDLLY